jgi:hypothetical protein
VEQDLIILDRMSELYESVFDFDREEEVERRSPSPEELLAYEKEVTRLRDELGRSSLENKERGGEEE